MTRLFLSCCCALLVLAGSGCKSIGPHTVARDRIDYSDSVSASWKRQTLLNIVKLRYIDPPIFVDVNQIVAGYSLEFGANAGGTIASKDAVSGNFFTLGGASKYTDRPTVTYTPLTGNKFVKALVTPLPPDAIFFTIQSGWAADTVLFATARAMNGLKNADVSLNGVTPPDPSFLRAIELLRKIQNSGGVGMRLMIGGNKQPTTIVTFQTKDIAPEIKAEAVELRTLLHLNPNTNEFKLVYAPTPSNDAEIALQSRSLMHIMMTLASQIDAPIEHVKQGRTTPGLESLPAGSVGPRMIQIHSSREKPDDVFAAVFYHDYWFWISDRDLKSKRTFTILMLLFTLADSGEKENLPLLTIPTN
jgi:hypothetical protein